MGVNQFCCWASLWKIPGNCAVCGSHDVVVTGGPLITPLDKEDFCDEMSRGGWRAVLTTLTGNASSGGDCTLAKVPLPRGVAHS